MQHPVMVQAAYRHRWVVAWRDLISREPERSRRFERVRVASLASFDQGEQLDDQQIAARVEELTRATVSYEEREPGTTRSPM